MNYTFTLISTSLTLGGVFAQQKPMWLMPGWTTLVLVMDDENADEAVEKSQNHLQTWLGKERKGVIMW